jgi:indolepyruvate ferredoxin oxidoreductase beta subunit
MKYDIILAGVGGQGVLSVSAIIASSAMKEGLHVKQSEVHGMSQRGGAVLANLRLSDRPIASDLIPLGSASMILSMEPLESLRYLRFLDPAGTIITASDPMVNIPDYPPLDGLLASIQTLGHPSAAAAPGTPQLNAVLIEAERLAREAGSVRATNMVMVGAASHHLPVQVETIEHFIESLFARKGERVVATNLKAFLSGREAAATWT